MKRAVVTGITGQDGSYLAELLVSRGYVVHGTTRHNSTANTARLRSLLDDPRINDVKLFLHEGDTEDSDRLIEILYDVQPDEIYHLAAQSSVGLSFERPEYTCESTGMGTVRLLEAMRRYLPEARLYQASSSEMFGQVREVPQKESTPFYPRSPYGAAKAFAHWMTVNYRESYGMFACNGILFNHESPRRGVNYVTRKITHGAAHIKAGLQDKLYLGNLDVKRDWGYAREYVEAMWLMLQQDKPEDYVIATGTTHSVREWVEQAFSQLGLDWEKYVEIDPKFYRPAEVDIVVGDATRAEEQLGWKAKTSFKELVRLMVEADVALLSAEQ